MIAVVSAYPASGDTLLNVTERRLVLGMIGGAGEVVPSGGPSGARLYDARAGADWQPHPAEIGYRRGAPTEPRPFGSLEPRTGGGTATGLPDEELKRAADFHNGSVLIACASQDQPVRPSEDRYSSPGRSGKAIQMPADDGRLDPPAAPAAPAPGAPAKPADPALKPSEVGFWTYYWIYRKAGDLGSVQGLANVANSATDIGIDMVNVIPAGRNLAADVIQTMTGFQFRERWLPIDKAEWEFSRGIVKDENGVAIEPDAVHAWSRGITYWSLNVLLLATGVSAITKAPAAISGTFGSARAVLGLAGGGTATVAAASGVRVTVNAAGAGAAGLTGAGLVGTGRATSELYSMGSGGGGSGAPKASPLEGSRNLDVRNPATGNIITDIDSIKDGVLWEEKSAAFAIDHSKWVNKHITGKFNSYMEARKQIPGYENAPIGFKFDRKPVDPPFARAILDEIEALRRSNPDVDILLEW